MSKKVQQVITQRIIDLIDSSDDLSWEKPWVSVQHQNLVSGRSYRGMNQLMCYITSIIKGFNSPFWATSNQIARLGGRVRKEEWKNYTPIVLFKMLSYTVEDELGDKEERKYLAPVKYFRVYNWCQTEGIPEPKLKQINNDIEPLQAVEELIAALPEQPKIIREGDRAFYRPATDTITMPPVEHFNSAEAEAATRLHEICHWTQKEGRVPRPHITNGAFFGNPDYATEECVVELCTSWIMASLGFDFDGETLENSAAYLKSWVRVLKDDNTGRAIFRIGATSQRIYDFMTGATPEAKSEEAESEEQKAA